MQNGSNLGISTPHITSGEYPPPNPNPGDMWIDKFGGIHSWEGHFWVAIQTATTASSTPSQYFVGTFNGNPIWYGKDTPVNPTSGTYWIDQNNTVRQAIAYTQGYVNGVIQPSFSWDFTTPEVTLTILGIFRGKTPASRKRFHWSRSTAAKKKPRRNLRVSLIKLKFHGSR
jgi:hypothetical protein